MPSFTEKSTESDKDHITCILSHCSERFQTLLVPALGRCVKPSDSLGFYVDGLPRWCSGKESASQRRRLSHVSSIPVSGSSPGGGNGNLLQGCCLENPMDRGACWATVHGVAKSRTWLSTHILRNHCIPQVTGADGVLLGRSWGA